VLDAVRGYRIPFISNPPVKNGSLQTILPQAEAASCDIDMERLQAMGAVVSEEPR